MGGLEGFINRTDHDLNHIDHIHNINPYRAVLRWYAPSVRGTVQIHPANTCARTGVTTDLHLANII